MTAAGPFDPANVKSRAVRHETFRLADGAPDRAFVHLTASVLAGREAGVLRETAGALLAVLRESFPGPARSAGATSRSRSARCVPTCTSSRPADPFTVLIRPHP